MDEETTNMKIMEKRDCKKCGSPMDCWTYRRTLLSPGEETHTVKWICSYNANHSA